MTWFLPFLAMALALVVSACQKNTPAAAREQLVRQQVEVRPQAAIEAARAGNLGQLQLLREAGLDLGLANETGETPLQAALAAGQSAVVADLLQPRGPSPDAGVAQVLRGAASVRVRSPGSQSALSWALARRETGLLKQLLDHGADPNKSFNTPASEDFIAVLGDAHFAYYLRREENVTPLMLAASSGQEEAVEILLQAGAKPGAQTARHKTVAIWLAGKNHHVGTVQLLLGKKPRPGSPELKVRVSLSRQKATIYRDGQPVDSSPISSGRKDFPTPKGAFVVTNKYKDWKSTLYEDASMPYFMRLSCADFGLHAGVLPGYPASHGCIRMPYQKAQAFFAKVDVGTLVEIVD